MYALPRTNYLRRSLLVNNQRPNPPRFVVSQSERVKHQLHALGVSRIAMHSMESRYLPHVIHPDEYIQGVVYGKSDDGFAMLLATDKRAIFLDKKPLFVNMDEITYDVVSGVSLGNIGFGSTVTLHTRIKDYTIMTLNEKCAKAFVEAIETRCIAHQNSGVNRYNYPPNREEEI